MAETRRVAIVTGAAGGIGRAMTSGLLAAGVRVAGVDRDREPLEALAASAREEGKAPELLTIQADLTNDTAVDEITKATRARFGRIDILVNNAGIGPGSIRPDSWQRPLKFWEITPDLWRRFVAVHATAPLALANAVVPEMMREVGDGSSTSRPASARRRSSMSPRASRKRQRLPLRRQPLGPGPDARRSRPPRRFRDALAIVLTVRARRIIPRACRHDADRRIEFFHTTPSTEHCPIFFLFVPEN
jgi:NAD(P)-dependent dehydrogenase (short-subunit alcohol dehydrogenase family)